MKHSLVTGTILTGLVAALNAHGITFELNYEFTGGASPSGPPPWVVVELIDAAGGVQLTIRNSGLTGSEFNRTTFLNVADAYVGSLQFTQQAKLGTFDDPVISQGLDAFRANSGEYFDVRLEFATANGDGTKRFGAGESVTYLITSTISGLDAQDFNLTSVGGHRGPFHAAPKSKPSPTTKAA